MVPYPGIRRLTTGPATKRSTGSKKNTATTAVIECLVGIGGNVKYET